MSMNQLPMMKSLGFVVPIKVCRYLLLPWSLYLMYLRMQGWEMENHTQTAVNNFLGLHR